MIHVGLLVLKFFRLSQIPLAKILGRLLELVRSFIFITLELDVLVVKYHVILIVESELEFIYLVEGFD